LDGKQRQHPLASYTAGDTVYYASGTTLTKLAIGTAYQAFQVNAGATAPSWQPSATSVLTTQGDLLYASGANTLARLAKDTNATRYLSNAGTSNNPSWAQISLTNGVTGILPVANGGTNASSASITAFNNITGYSASGATGTTTTNLVFSTSPTLTTPTLGAALATSIKFGSGTVLSSYEQGTWTPTDASGAGLTLTSQSGIYTRIGNTVYFNCIAQYPVTADASLFKIGSLPFSPNRDGGASVGYTTYSTAGALFVQVSNATTGLRLLTTSGSFLTNANMSNSLITITGTYTAN
jgi:hypothetical protein